MIFGYGSAFCPSVVCKSGAEWVAVAAVPVI